MIDPIELGKCLPGLHRYAKSLTRNNERALDLVQDSVERALSKAALFDGVNLRAWISTICLRIFLNDIRKQKNRGTNIAMEDADQRWWAVEADQPIKLHYKSVIEALENLSANDQAVITSIAFHGLDYDAAARQLNIPIGTVRSRLCRARERLSDAVENDRTRSAKG
ncbi:MAG: sigma-70 family RNA polymerase sigma factor [Parvularculaceae bacterium]|nr:sigma-70 family RNA polymerase sigma factor [Parvularculaceae bacterium]